MRLRAAFCLWSFLAIAAIATACSEPDIQHAEQAETEQGVAVASHAQGSEALRDRSEDGSVSEDEQTQTQSDPVEVDTVIIDLRLWQDVDEPTSLSLRAQVVGDDSASLPRRPLQLDGPSGGYAPISNHPYASIAIAGVEVRVHQRLVDPERIFVRACASTCDIGAVAVSWRPLGMTPLPLDDGFSDDGQFRNGDLRIAIPRGNPQLNRDREHLLALRDVFAAEPPLDWKAGTPISEWEGVTVSGSPPRVTELKLSNRGLTGEIWGYLGDLDALRVLRLDDNEWLSGWIPSKLQLLTNLEDVRLSGTSLIGCVPPRLRAVPGFDVEPERIPTCPDSGQEPPWHRYAGMVDYLSSFAVGTYFLIRNGGGLVFDVPDNASVHGKLWDFEDCESDGSEQSVFEPCAATGWSLHYLDHRAPELYGVDIWVFISIYWPGEIERSHYAGCVYDCNWWAPSPAARIERFAASMWLNTAITQETEFTWRWP